MDQDGEATDGDEVNGETSRSTGDSDNLSGEGTATPVPNKEYVATAKSSTCIILETDRYRLKPLATTCNICITCLHLAAYFSGDGKLYPSPSTVQNQHYMYEHVK